MKLRNTWFVMLTTAVVAWAGCKSKDKESEEKAKEAVPECPAKYKLLTADQRARTYRCHCSPSVMQGTVWGTDIYTIDSSICAAALHSGALTNKGGIVEIEPAPGCNLYMGTARNGIQSRNWKKYGASFYFKGKGDGKCFAFKQGGPCPPRYRLLPPEARKGPWACTCSPQSLKGPVWGTDIYTTDSSVCAAALHVGAVGKDGGKVTILPASGCTKYQGTKRNGVVSQAWGKFASSFYFKGKGDGKCFAFKQGGPCPPRYKDLPAEAKKGPWACTCSPKNLKGPVWGTDIYTTDSSVCAAALHVGAVGKDGGKVTILPASGCTKYQGTKRNGVVSQAWGKFASSFYFKGKGKGKCE